MSTPVSLDNLFSVFPNPCSLYVTLSLPKDVIANENSIAKIFNSLGLEVGAWKLVQGENILDGSTELTINLAAFADGVYFIKLNDEVRKIIIQK